MIVLTSLDLIAADQLAGVAKQLEDADRHLGVTAGNEAPGVEVGTPRGGRHQVQVLLAGDRQLVHLGDRIGRDRRAGIDGQRGHRARSG